VKEGENPSLYRRAFKHLAWNQDGLKMPHGPVHRRYPHDGEKDLDPAVLPPYCL
jgi:hypothetical protein